MTHTTNDTPVTVEQCDRELFALIAPDMCALILDGELDQHRELQAIARHRLAALASAPAGVKITVRQKTPVVADYGDNFLVAQVSADGKTVGIDHPCDAVWSDVDRAHTALRDYINERIAAQDKCPFKPRDAALARPRAAVGERGLLEQARDAIKDMLREDDGQAWKEARKLLPRLDAALQSPSAKVEE